MEVFAIVWIFSEFRARVPRMFSYVSQQMSVTALLRHNFCVWRLSTTGEEMQQWRNHVQLIVSSLLSEAFRLSMPADLDGGVTEQ